MNLLTDDKKIVRKFLKEHHYINVDKFEISNFPAQEGEHCLVKLYRNEEVGFFGEEATIRYTYVSIDNKDYLKWKKIYLRKDKLQKIIKNVKIQ